LGEEGGFPGKNVIGDIRKQILVIKWELGREKATGEEKTQCGRLQRIEEEGGRIREQRNWIAHEREERCKNGVGKKEMDHPKYRGAIPFATIIPVVLTRRNASFTLFPRKGGDSSD
jgi:hypothetical protein